MTYSSMEYQASEIIERAKNLADMGNARYISHKEAIQYLNDAYNYVYQLAINRGDSDYVRTIEDVSGDIPMPPDFYQLRLVKDRSGALLVRRAYDAAPNEPGYELINGRIRITGSSSASVSYYPKPKLLTFPDASVPLPDLPLPELCAYYDGHLVYKSEGGLTAYDLSTKESAEIEYEGAVDALYACASYFIVRSGSEAVYMDWCGEEVKRVQAPVILRKSNGDVIAVDEIDYHRQRIDVGDATYAQATVEHIYHIDDGALIRDGEEEIALADEFYALRKFGRDYVVYRSGDQLFALFDGEEWPLDIDYERVIGYEDDYVIVDNGITASKESLLPDIVLNYPTNTYYTLICYQLATYFVIKQGGDISLLAEQLERAKLEFADDVVDSYTCMRIKSVY